METPLDNAHSRKPARPGQDQSTWDFWVDRGGTFTDVIGRAPDATLHSLKLLSVNPDQYPDAAMEGVRRMLGVATGAPLPSERIGRVKIGTTVATNALLERKGTPTLFVTTEGFKDLLAIGTQNRPDLFALDIVKPAPLYGAVLEVGERVGADGKVLKAPEPEAVARGLTSWREQGMEAVAICLLHGYRYPDHECLVADLARQAGFVQVSVSHAVSPLMKCVPRGDTTVVDAYLSPVLQDYVCGVAGALGAGVGQGGQTADGPRLYFMQSNGGLAEAAAFSGKDAILSGPAGGVVGLARVAGEASLEAVVGFDMGGTSTDVSYYAGAFERRFQTEISGVRMRVPMMRIETVAAGGGSIISYDGARLRVGPESAGADPGPACYRKGGPLTVTDANVMTGKLHPDFFPKVFGPGADQPIDVDSVRAGFADLGREMGNRQTGEALAPERLADGALAIAVETMALAIKTISIARGHDVTRAGLVCFGGAAAQHACLVADALSMADIVIHPLSGLLSAYGIGLADIRAIREEAVEARFGPELYNSIEDIAERLAAVAREDILAQGALPDRVETIRRLHIRYEGTDTPLVLPTPDLETLADDFATEHKARFGFTMADQALILEAVSVEAVGGEAIGGEAVGGEDSGDPAHDHQAAPSAPVSVPEPQAMTRFYSAGQWHEAAIHRREALHPGVTIAGPAIIAEPHATIIVEPGWEARLTGQDHIRMVRRETASQTVEAAVVAGTGEKAGTDSQPDPIRLEIFNSLFMAAAEQMGVALENTASSVNIKERLDFSCALFDPSGALIANAPHIPVHLGSMGDSVRTVLTRHGQAMKPGDVFVLNDPYNGGTHLPDITVVMPVFEETDEGPSNGAPPNLLALTAARGHHADVGGLTPGSMPATSRHIDEEGVLLDALPLIRDGVFLEEEIRTRLLGAAYPARSVDQNIADLKAQVAACERGAQELRRLARVYGKGTVQAYMGHVLTNAADAVRRVLKDLEPGRFTYEMDSGRRIAVAITPYKDETGPRARVDFNGTSPMDPLNFNAPTAIVRAAVLYVFRCLVADAIPLNDGCLAPLDIVVPDASMLSPDPPAAVVAGNVETSQAVTNALFGALGRLSAGQGTMNNLTFGNADHQYYETLCGGAGASREADGADAVHTHMTNSRLTDPEVIEWRYPVRLERFGIREGSGGAGEHRGGHGTIRHLTVLEPMNAALLSGHREVANFGLEGGEPGALGQNAVRRADGTMEHLPGCFEIALEPGDTIMIETPGGGGFGKPRS